MPHFLQSVAFTHVVQRLSRCDDDCSKLSSLQSHAFQKPETAQRGQFISAYSCNKMSMFEKARQQEQLSPWQQPDAKAVHIVANRKEELRPECGPVKPAPSDPSLRRRPHLPIPPEESSEYSHQLKS